MKHKNFQIDAIENGILIKGLRDFDLTHTLECGQCFRWEKEVDGSYTIVAFRHAINLRTEGLDQDKCLYIDNATIEDWDNLWRSYFDIDRDYGQLKKTILKMDKSKHMKEAIVFGAGMRILNQDRWETIISFILSQNNNMARIKKCVEGVCQHFGEPIGEYKGKMRYSFPTPERLAEIEEAELDVCKLGYRAKYISQTARKLVGDGVDTLEMLADADKSEVNTYLRTLSGIGPKVANCITLFAFRKYDSFPVDVWVKRIMSVLYGLDEGDLAGMERFAAEKYGDLGGFAQQYLFFYARERGL